MATTLCVIADGAGGAAPKRELAHPCTIPRTLPSSLRELRFSVGNPLRDGGARGGFLFCG